MKIIKAKVWRKIDIQINSKIKYDNPYKDIDIIVTFIHESNKIIKLNAFWNGDNEWIVRFTPILTGIWNYSINCSDENNDINYIVGKVEVKENEQNLNIEKHGFLKISSNKRYFEYEDNTPFFWLGDTNWQSFNLNNYYECNYPNCNCHNQFRHILNNRKEKNFNVYQTYFDTSNGNIQNSENMWIDKFNKINPQVFIDVIDKMFEEIVESNMIIALGFGLHYVTPSAIKEDELCTFAKYIVARYSAYPIVWITGQEIDLEIENQHTYDIWKNVAKIVKLNDPYHHPMSGHMFSHPKKIDDLNAQPWHDFWAIQSGHYGMAKIATQEHYKMFYDLKPTKPILETEADYEDIKCSNRFNGYEATRISAWKSIQCGSCGYTYGGNGIWASCYNTTDNTFCLGDYSTEPWYMGLDKPASYEMKHLIKFYNLVGFENLIPKFDNKNEEIVISATKNNSTVIVYFYNESNETCELDQLLNEKYYSYWYNPLTGNFIRNNCFIPNNGNYKVPNKPTKSDWVLLVTTNNYKIKDFEEIYYDKILDVEISKENINKYLDKKTKIDSCKKFCVSNEDELCDFKNVKYNPYCDITTKTIEIELDKEQYIDLIEIDFESNSIPKFRIYGIDAKGIISIVTDCKYRKPNIFENDKNIILEKIGGNYKKIKIIILNNNIDLKVNNVDLFK